MRVWTKLVITALSGVAVYIAIVSYRSEVESRNAQKVFQAWQLVYTADIVKGGRGLARAIEEIHRAGDKFDGMNMHGFILDSVDIRGASLRNVDLSDASLVGSDIRAANLTGALLQRCNLTGADLRNVVGAHYKDAVLECADMRSLNLRGAGLDGANLAGADLREANLTNALVTKVSFRCADLRGAILRDLRSPQRARWRHSNIAGANCDSTLKRWLLTSAEDGGGGAVDIADNVEWLNYLRNVGFACN